MSYLIRRKHHKTDFLNNTCDNFKSLQIIDYLYSVNEYLTATEDAQKLSRELGELEVISSMNLLKEIINKDAR
jgi:hypothetical protein